MWLTAPDEQFTGRFHVRPAHQGEDLRQLEQHVRNDPNPPVPGVQWQDSFCQQQPVFCIEWDASDQGEPIEGRTYAWFAARKQLQLDLYAIDAAYDQYAEDEAAILSNFRALEAVPEDY